MQENQNQRPPIEKKEKGWYDSLKLSQKFTANAVLGMLLLTIGIVVLYLKPTSPELGTEAIVHLIIGIITINAGVWFFAAGSRYQSQLDAIRIAKRNRGNFSKNNRKGPAAKAGAPRA